MVLDMNIKLEGIDEEFLDDLEEFIEDYRVEYFIINPKDKDELVKTQELCKEYERFKYTIPFSIRDMKDENCIAIKIDTIKNLDFISDEILVIDSKNLDDEFIEKLNSIKNKGVVLDSKESDNRLINFVYCISHSSLKDWSKKGITDIDYNKIALQSDYPKYSYDDLFDALLKNISDLTFRAEQTIAAGGTRTSLRIFGFL